MNNNCDQTRFDAEIREMTNRADLLSAQTIAVQSSTFSNNERAKAEIREMEAKTKLLEAQASVARSQKSDIFDFAAAQMVDTILKDRYSAVAAEMDLPRKEAKTLILTERYKAKTRKLAAEAELLEAQARDTRAQAEHHEVVVESMKVINTLQKLQVQKQIDEINGSATPAN